MKKKINPLYGRDTLEFVTVALEYASFIEKAGEYDRSHFVDKATKLLPLLYLKASLLPQVEEPEECYPEFAVTGQLYESVRSHIASVMGEYDIYLDTFNPDMPFSDTPVVATVSESLADVFQDIGNFIALFRQENEVVMQEAMALCRINFRNYWGQQLLNALKALHAVRYNNEDNPETNEIR